MDTFYINISVLKFPLLMTWWLFLHIVVNQGLYSVLYQNMHAMNSFVHNKVAFSSCCSQPLYIILFKVQDISVAFGSWMVGQGIESKNENIIGIFSQNRPEVCIHFYLNSLINLSDKCQGLRL